MNSTGQTLHRANSPRKLRLGTGKQQGLRPEEQMHVVGIPVPVLEYSVVMCGTVAQKGVG